MKIAHSRAKGMKSITSAIGWGQNSLAPDIAPLEGTPAPIRERVQRLLDMGDGEMTRAHFESALDHYNEASHLVRSFGAPLTTSDEAVRLSARSARCLLRLGRPSDALVAIESAARAADRGPAPATELDLEVAIQWGEVYVDLGDYRRA